MEHPRPVVAVATFYGELLALSSRVRSARRFGGTRGTFGRMPRLCLCVRASAYVFVGEHLLCWQNTSGQGSVHARRDASARAPGALVPPARRRLIHVVVPTFHTTPHRHTHGGS